MLSGIPYEGYEVTQQKGFQNEDEIPPVDTLFWSYRMICLKMFLFSLAGAGFPQTGTSGPGMEPWADPIQLNPLQ